MHQRIYTESTLILRVEVLESFSRVSVCHLVKLMIAGWARDVQQQVVIKDMDIQNEGSILEWQKEIDIMAYVQCLI